MKINVEIRINRWHDQATKQQMPFTFKVIDDQTIEVTLARLPDAIPEAFGQCLGSRLARITALRLAELERLGARYGVFRPAETRSKQQINIFRAYDLPVPA